MSLNEDEIKKWRRLSNELRDAMMRLPQLPITPDWQVKECPCEQLKDIMKMICSIGDRAGALATYIKLL